MITKVEQLDLIDIDSLRVNNSIDAYFHWKQLDAEIRGLSTRGINFPAEVSENLACYALGYKLNKGGQGDAYDVERGKVIEMKASSAIEDTAPSSFSPKEEYDELVFIKLDRDTDQLYIYLTGMNSEDIKSIAMNKTENLADQQAQGRRPRFSIMNKIITPMGLAPAVIFDIRNKKIIK